MIEPIEEYKSQDGERLLRVYYDEAPESPRDWDNLGAMTCFHRQYNLGDEHQLKAEQFSGWGELEEYLKEEEEAEVLLPLYLYDHSGITISTKHVYPYNDIWDAGQVGFIWAGREKIADSGVDLKRAEGVLEREVKTYDQYLTGSVYRYEIVSLTPGENRHAQGEVIESCGGFYGSSVEESGVYEHVSLEDYLVV